MNTPTAVFGLKIFRNDFVDAYKKTKSLQETRNCSCDKILPVDAIYCPYCGIQVWKLDKRIQRNILTVDNEETPKLINGYEAVCIFEDVEQLAYGDALYVGIVATLVSPYRKVENTLLENLEWDLKAVFELHDMWDKNEFGLWVVQRSN